MTSPTTNEPVVPRFLAIVGSWLMHAAVPLILFGQAADVAPPSPEVLQDGLKMLARLAKPETHQTLGFDSVAQAASATVGQPFHVYYVRLNELQAYQPNSSPHTLFHDARSLIYPVLAEGQLRSSITCDHRGSKWVASRFGEPSRIRLLVDARAALGAFVRDSAVERNSFVLDIPAIHTAFVAFRNDHQAPGSRGTAESLQMVQLGRNGMSTKAGEGRTANQIFSELARRAKRVPIDKPT